jgi:hypothetical protein
MHSISEFHDRFYVATRRAITLLAYDQYMKLKGGAAVTKWYITHLLTPAIYIAISRCKELVQNVMITK